MPTMPRGLTAVEWPTVALIAATYLAWGLLTAHAEALGPMLALPLLALAVSMHASLTHEVSHGHPTRRVWLNDLLVFPALSLFVPHDRYRDTHLAHHHDPILTDPYDDPESNFLDPSRWRRLPAPVRGLLRFNNSLAGRMLVGPLLSTAGFYRGELRAMLAGDRAVLLAWGKHAVAVGLVVAWLSLVGEVGALAYLAAAYAGISLQHVRSYLEHRPHPQARGRTVIVEGRGPLAWLFLNNNLHAVHHAHPRLAWYKLPEVYRARRETFLRRNHGYRYAGYWAVFRHHLLRPKDPVAHPLMPAGAAPEAPAATVAPPPAGGAAAPG